MKKKVSGARRITFGSPHFIKLNHEFKAHRERERRRRHKSKRGNEMRNVGSLALLKQGKIIQASENTVFISVI